MENPATWGEAERVVNEAIGYWELGRSRGAVGLSKARAVTDALREAHLIGFVGLDLYEALIALDAVMVLYKAAQAVPENDEAELAGIAALQRKLEQALTGQQVFVRANDHIDRLVAEGGADAARAITQPEGYDDGPDDGGFYRRYDDETR